MPYLLIIMIIGTPMPLLVMPMRDVTGCKMMRLEMEKHLSNDTRVVCYDTTSQYSVMP